jgi:predicted permease
MITLGTQLARKAVFFCATAPSILAVATRLLIGPLMALALIWLLALSTVSSLRFC